MTVADFILRTCSNGILDIGLGFSNRIFSTISPGQIGGDGGRERATGPMIIATFNSFSFEYDKAILFSEIKQIRAFAFFQMSPLDENTAAAGSGQCSGGPLHILDAFDVCPARPRLQEGLV